VIDYEAVYENLFIRNLRRYSSLKKLTKKRIDRILINQYHNTEFLDDLSGKLNLIGCRSARIDRNFRIIFVICEECRNFKECEFCFCNDLPDTAIIFLTMGPHNKAYSIK